MPGSIVRSDSAHEAIILPPHSIEAEQAVLGALMLNNASARDIRDALTVEHFYSGAHRLIFDAISGGNPASSSEPCGL